MMETFLYDKLNGKNGEIKTSACKLPRFYSLACINLDFKSNTPDGKKTSIILKFCTFLLY